MKKILAKSKTLRHRYKRYAAVLAGAAIMAGTPLVGIPISKAAASEAPIPSPLVTTDQSTTVVDTDKQIIADKTDPINRLGRQLKAGWHEHLDGWPSSGDTQGWSENGHIYYRNDNDRADEYNNNNNNTLSNPVDFVIQYASLYGFDSNNDMFSLVSKSNHEATVQIIKSDTRQRFKIELENHQDWRVQDWRIVAIRGIGDNTHPATYQSIQASYP